MIVRLLPLLALLGCTGETTSPADGTGVSGTETETGEVSISGEVTCDGCGAIIVAAFDSEEMDVLPLTDVALAGPGAFSLALPAGSGDIWLLGFADADSNGAPSPGEPIGATGPLAVACTGP